MFTKDNLQNAFAANDNYDASNISTRDISFFSSPEYINIGIAYRGNEMRETLKEMLYGLGLTYQTTTSPYSRCDNHMKPSFYEGGIVFVIPAFIAEIIIEALTAEGEEAEVVEMDFALTETETAVNLSMRSIIQPHLEAEATSTTNMNDLHEILVKMFGTWQEALITEMIVEFLTDADAEPTLDELESRMITLQAEIVLKAVEADTLYMAGKGIESHRIRRQMIDIRGEINDLKRHIKELVS
jgi:hypothetical protein